jgi:hypothetical protein
VGTARYRGIAAGRFHSLGVATDGKVWGWGSNGFGQLGDGTTEDRLEPVWSSGLGVGAKSVGAGWEHSVALGVDGKAYGWGGNGSGQLGDGTATERVSAVGVVGLLGNLKAVEAGGQYTLGLGEDGVVYGWGANESGQLGDGTKVERRSPVASVRGEIRAGLVVGSLSAGAQHALILANGEPVPGVPEVSLGSLAGTYGTPFVGRIEAAGRLILEYGATGLPEGLVVDPATGVISGTPVQVGTFSVLVSARNSAGTGAGTLTIQLDKKPLGLSGISANSKEYDGTPAAPLTGTPVLVGVAGDDAVTLGGRAVGQFADASAGTSKRVVVSGYLLSGARAANYTLATSVELSADILPRPVSLPNAAAVSKDYDGTTAAGITGLEPISNRVTGDDLAARVVFATFPRSTVGTALEVDATLELTGASVANYRLVPPTGLRADIRPAPVQIQLAGTIQTYSGSPLPVFAVTVPSGIAVSLTYNGGANPPTAAGTYAVQARALGENYVGDLAGTFQIQPKVLTGRVTVSDKPFDGSTLATVTSRQVDGVVIGDSVALGVGSVRFTDALLGTNKALVADDPLLTGVSVANYRLGEVTVVPAAILNNPPVFDAFPKLVVVEGKTLQELLTARDGDLPQQTLVFRLLQAPSGVTLTASGLLQWTPRRTDIPGDYPLRVELSDGVTNVQRSGVITVAPSGIDPVVIPIPDASVVENRASGAPLSSPDPDLKGALTWSLVRGPAGFSVATDGRWTWQPGESLGGTRWTVVAEATDGQIRSRVSFQVDVVEDNQLPVWLDTPPPEWTEGREAVWQVAARDADEPVQALAYRLVSGPSGLTLSPSGQVRWTPSEAQGPQVHPLLVAVGDGQVSVTNLFQIQVREVNQAPVWTGEAAFSVDEGQSLERQLAATDADLPNQPLAFDLLSGPVGLTVSREGQLRWLPSETQGPSTNSVRVSVNDGTETVEREFSVVVREVNVAPTIAAVADAAIEPLKPWTIRLSAEDTDVPVQRLVFARVQGPTGLTVAENGTVSWTPSTAQTATTNRVEVSVSDGVVQVTNSFRVVVVRAPNTPPVIAGVPAQQVAETGSLAFALSASDADVPAQRLTFALVSGPVGLTVSPSGAVAFRPTEAQGPSTNTVVVRVTDDGVPPLSATNAFTVLVREVNVAPEIVAVPDVVIDPLKPWSIALAARDADLPAQRLVFALVRGPVGLTVSESGALEWTPSITQGDTTNRVEVSVSDGLAQVTAPFTVVVRSSNQRPQIVDVPLRRVAETGSLVFNMSASDVDLPAQRLTFALVSGPAGLTVSPSGAVAFRPTEAQGPSTNTVVVRVTDDGVPPLSATNAFTVLVREVNVAPEIVAVPDVVIDPLKPWSIALAARDSDLPVQRLAFALVQGPAGLTVSDSGAVAWTPSITQGDTTNRVEVSVSDGLARITAAFTVVVRPSNLRPRIADVPLRRVAETGNLAFSLSASDADVPAQRLTFALVSGPAGLTVSPSGAVAFRPTEAQGPSTNTVVVRVTDDGVPALSGTNSFTVLVTEINAAPTFVSLVNRRIRELSPMSFRLIGRDTDLPAQRLTYTLVDGPAGLTVAEDGLVNWTPSEEQGPSTNTVTVRVSDNGNPALGSTGSFTIFVTEANSAPTVVNAFSRTISENVGLNFTLIGRDSDLPAQRLTFSLVSGPRGMTVSEAGVLVWNPTEDQGPSTNTVVVRVSDDGVSSLSATTNFVVTVRESNTLPVLVVSNLTVAATGRLAVSLKATDSDLPVQALSYRLELGPQGLSVSTNGLLEWTPPASLANTTNLVRVSVSDGVARVQANFRILVGPVGSGTGSEAKAAVPTRIAMALSADGAPLLRVSGPEGAVFQVEASDLSGSPWEPVGSVPAVQTLGEDFPPVEVSIPMDESHTFRRFRLRKF